MNTTTNGRADWRFRIGVLVFVTGQASTALIPVVATSSLPAEWKALLSGLLVFGISEVMTLVAIAIMGQAGFHRLERLFYRFLRKHAPPERVSLTRYRVGLVMFVVPLLMGLLDPYLSSFILVFGAHRPLFAVLGDVSFVTSFLVLGGEFWDKVRALFVHGARTTFPDQPPPQRY